jgi:hypothetical protein
LKERCRDRLEVRIGPGLVLQVGARRPGRAKRCAWYGSPPLLDDLPAWAAQQPPGNTMLVDRNLVTNTSTLQGRDKNLVSYAGGTLQYQTAEQAAD